MNNYFVYIMSNKIRSTIYIGVTNDLVRRVSEHQLGENSGFTSQYRLDRVVYYEVYPDPRSAIARETQLKGWRRAKKNQLIATMNPTWSDLSQELFTGMKPNGQPAATRRSRDSSTPLRSAQNDTMEEGLSK